MTYSTALFVCENTKWTRVRKHRMYSREINYQLSQINVQIAFIQVA